MNNTIFMLILAIAFLVTGCVNEDVKVPRVDGENPMIENINSDEKNLDNYIKSIKERSDAIKKSLENDTLTQTDMNIKSQELYELWDEMLNYLWDELKNSLVEEEFEKIQIEQRIWITEKEKTIEEAGKEFIGGSVYSLVVNTEAARITEERVYELYKILKEL